MSEKSVSREAESVREQTHEASRKKTSKIKSFKPKPSDSFTRADQHATVTGPNLGSNRNNPDRVVSNRERVVHIVVEAHGVSNPETTPEQFERAHEKAPVATEGSIDNRKVVRSSVTLGRHVTSDNGFQIAQRRNAAVVGNRNSTAKQFDARRKRSSSV
jgi:hypothetical protein